MCHVAKFGSLGTNIWSGEIANVTKLWTMKACLPSGLG